MSIGRCLTDARTVWMRPHSDVVLAIMVTVAVLLCAGPAAAQSDRKVEIVLSNWHEESQSLDATNGEFSKDGKYLLTGAQDRTARLWDLRTARKVRQFVHPGPVTALAFVPNANRALTASGGYDKTLRLWDLVTGAVLREIKGEEVFALRFLDDRRVVIGERGAVRVIDIETGRESSRIKGKHFVSLAVSADGSQILTATIDQLLQHWDLKSGRELAKQTFPKDEGRTAVWHHNFAINGRLAIIALHDMAKSEVIIKVVGSDRVILRTAILTSKYGGVKLSPDATSFLVAGPDSLRSFDTISGRELWSVPASRSMEARTAVFSIRGDTIALRDDKLAWNLFDGGKGTTARLGIKSAPMTRVAVLPNSATIVTADTQGVRVWDSQTGHQVKALAVDRSPDEPAWSRDNCKHHFAVSPDGRLALIGRRGMSELVDLASGRVVRKFGNATNCSDKVVAAFAPNGKSVFVTDAKGRIEDFAIGQSDPAAPARIVSNNERVTALSISANARQLIANDQLVDVATGRSVTLPLISGEGQSSPVFGVFSPTGPTSLVAYADHSIRLLDDRLKELSSFSRHDYYVTSLAFSPNGTTMASASADASARIWNLSSGREIARLQGHDGWVNSVAFDEKGKIVVTAGTDGTFRIWDAETGASRATVAAYEDGAWLAITPEGFFDASSPDVAKNLSVVRGLDAYSIDQVYQALYRPDLVREKLAGDPKGLVRDAAAKLDLNKVIASGAAPRVSIVTAAGRATDDDVVVEASIAEQDGGGIGRIEWRVNGVTLGIESRGLQRLPDGAGSGPVASRPSVSVKRTLSLEPGDNAIEVVAYNGRDLIASDPARIVLTWDGERTATAPKLHVLAVGVNDYYDGRLKLSYAVPDAKALGDAMKKAGAAMYQSVEVTTVLDESVTADNLDRVFDEVSRKIHPRDVFVFFLAGHGKTVDGRYHFLPQNFRYEDETSIVKRGIDQDRFQSWFAKIPARKSVLLYDTCESGSLTGDRVQQRGIERVAALEKMTRAMGRTVLSASSDDAPALEGYRGHGVFTYALLDGLQSADTNGNGLIEITELAAFIDLHVPELSFKAFKMRQIPQMKIVGNSFPVVAKTSVIDAALAANARSSGNIPTKPTHVVVSQSPIAVYADAARSGAITERLRLGTTVTILDTANGWTLIAKDGKKLGFVEQNALAALN